ncbi:MAG: hypothetical protein IKT57_00365 [Clostridia bacterium]|nr:hypothetical protein [Clostridia bacterium]
MPVFRNLWEKYRNKLVTMRFLDFMLDFGLIKSALLFSAIPFFLICMCVPELRELAAVVGPLSLVFAFPLLFVLAILLVYLGFFECIARCLLAVLQKEE